MSLITNDLESLYGGVNQQSAEHRLSTQVEEMVNAYPTLDKGLLKRNPTTKLELSSPVTYSEDAWTYEYDRGLAGADTEKYSIEITEEGVQIINIVTGKVYTHNNGLSVLDIDGVEMTTVTNHPYLYPFAGSNGYAATTIKDTTFIVNKSKVPTLDNLEGSGDETPTTVNVKYAALDIIGTPDRSWSDTTFNTYHYQHKYAPSKMSAHASNDPARPHFNVYGSDTVITVDGKIIHIPVNAAYYLYVNIAGTIPMPSFSVWKNNLLESVKSALDPNLYEVAYEIPSGATGFVDAPLTITRLDGTVVAASMAVTFNAITDTGLGSLNSVEADYYTSPAVTGNYNRTVTPIENRYEDYGYIWVQRSEPTLGYTYSYSASDSLGNAIAGSVTGTNTETVAGLLRDDINGINLTEADAITNGDFFFAYAVGSVVRIVTVVNTMDTVEAGDSFGNQASFGWAREVSTANDLPKNLGFSGGIVKVIGTSDSVFSAYWLIYSEGQWRESLDPLAVTQLAPLTMPHTLVRNSDDTFTIQHYDSWESMAFGDEFTNPVPSFVSSVDNTSPKIKDIFFFKNRLGFITDRTAVMSEVGEYGNFWRTTVAAVLDSDPIDVTVDTTSAIALEYVTYLEDSLMLFSDKIQFKLEGGQLLSPKSVQVTQTSAYEININIRPIFMNDRIFFCVKRGGYTAVMEYYVKQNSTNAEANDITAHVQSYIDGDISGLSGSSINNMLFLTSKTNKDTIYVYKYYDSGVTRVQSAWFKWKVNGLIYTAFSFGKNLHLMLERAQNLATENWVLGTGTWSMDSVWDMSKLWVMSPASLSHTDQFEIMPIAPQDHADVFLDNVGFDVGGDPTDTTIPVDVLFGEWVMSANNKKEIRGHLKFKTVQISSEADSSFELYIRDTKRDSFRKVKSEYTVDRKPMVYGDAKNIRVGVMSNNSFGFRINTVSYEGNITRRARSL